MAYGDATAQYPPVLWEDFEGMEYHYRLKDLLEEFDTAFAIANGNPDDPRADEADKEWKRCRDKLEETALEFVAYGARLRLRKGEGR